MGYIDHWNATELLGKRTHWLLDIVFAGRIYRLAHSDLDVTSTKLGTLHYSSSIVSDIIFSTGFELFSDSIEKNSISIETFFDNDNIASLINTGHDLSGCPGILSKWIEGQDYDDRRVFMIGRLRDPQYGGTSIPVRFSLEEVFFDDETMIPDNNAQTSESTTGTSYIAKEDIGIFYPIVIGNPGYMWNASSRNNTEVLAGSQGVWISKLSENQELLIAGHETSITSVYLIADGVTEGKSYATLVREDAKGRRITTIPSAKDSPLVGVVIAGINGIGSSTYLQAIYDADTPTNDLDVQVYVGWATAIDTVSSDLGGGLVVDGKTIHGAGDTIKYVLRESQASIDFNRIDTIAESINSYKIDCTIDAQTKPWDWIRQNMLPILPLSVVNGVNGLYFLRWNDTKSNNAVCSIDSDINHEISFGEYISADTTRLANNISLNYALDIKSDQFQRTVEISSHKKWENATATILGPQPTAGGTIQILVRATRPEQEGSNIHIHIGSAGVGATSFAENIREKTVTILCHSSGAPWSSVNDIVNGINQNLTTITATLLSGDGGRTVNGAYTVDGSVVQDAFAQDVYTTNLGELRTRFSLYSELSQNRYRNIIKDGIFKKALDSIVIYDEATALSIITWMAKAYSFPHQTVEAIMPESSYGWLQLGQTVTLTCSRLGLSSKTAIIKNIEYGSDGMIAFRFHWIEDPIAD